MATSLADLLFVAIAAAITVAQAFILRSTARGMRRAGPGGGARLEWAYAIAPALALAVLLAAVWVTMHPAAVEVRGMVPESLP